MVSWLDKCPVCKTDNSFGEMALEDSSVDLNVKNGEVIDVDHNEAMEWSLPYCKNCGAFLKWDNNQWREATGDEVYMMALDFFETIVGEKIKAEDFDKLKMLRMLDKLEQ